MAAVYTGAITLPSPAERAAASEHHLALHCRRFCAAPSYHSEVALPQIHRYLDRLVAQLMTARRGPQRQRAGGMAGGGALSLCSNRLYCCVYHLMRYVRPLRSADYAALLL